MTKAPLAPPTSSPTPISPPHPHPPPPPPPPPTPTHPTPPDLVHRQRTASSRGSFSQGLSRPPSRQPCALCPGISLQGWPWAKTPRMCLRPRYGKQAGVGVPGDAFLHCDSITPKSSSRPFPSTFFWPLFRAPWEVGLHREVLFSQVVPVVKNLPGVAGNTRDMGSIHGSGRSLEEERPTHFSILAWRIPRTEEPGGLQSVGLERVGHDWWHHHIVEVF